MKTALAASCSLLLLALSSTTSHAQLLWTCGLNDNNQPCTQQNPCTGGGPTANFVQENGTINPLPGVPNSPVVDRQSDNDYYFLGDFSLTIDSVLAYYGAYTPVGTVAANEESAERAFAGGDNDLRYHFNLPDGIQPTDLLTVGFKWISLDTGGHSDPRYGVEVYFNGVLVQPQIVVRPAQLGVAYTTPQFTAASVNAQTGIGYDNIVSLKGISYSGDGGGAWMGLDYVQLKKATEVIPPAAFPWSVGKDDDDWPAGDGGGPNASFVQESFSLNALPGNPNSPEVKNQADNDYYFAGSYTATIGSVTAMYGPYTPVGTVAANEEAAERALTSGETEQRYHFNLPNELLPTDRVSVTFDALNLDDTAPTPKFGVEVYFNGVKVQPELLITPAQVGQAITTPSFLLGDVNAQTGAGADNIVTLKGISKASEGGGDWMGIDYIKLDRNTLSVPPPVLPVQVGMDDDSWPDQFTGGGTNAYFAAPDGGSNPLPGSPFNEALDFDPDDDYYFAGIYTTVIPSNGSYTPVGNVYANEEGMARGFVDPDNTTRIHFNLPSYVRSDDLLEITIDPLAMAAVADPRYGVEIYFNNVLIMPLRVIGAADLNQAIKTPRFTAGSVNAAAGPGYDNIITLKGTSYADQGGGDFIGFDYIRLVAIPRIAFPWTVGLDDNGWPCNVDLPANICHGGGANANFIQENGAINSLPGKPNNPLARQQSDNDYYFAGEYNTTIDSVTAFYGPYTPVGTVLVNEEGTERAFAAADNDLRYHFNLPTTLGPDDQLQVTFDSNNLDEEASIPDPRYGIEVYFNGVLVQSQITIRHAQLDVDYTTPAFTLASVNAKTGLGYDNIVSLKGYNHSSEGGGNWMGIDYVRLDPVPLKLNPPVLNGNQVTLTWTGNGQLQWASSLLGPWNNFDPRPASGYSEAVLPGQNRFYRLQK